MHPKVKEAYDRAKFQIPASAADNNEEVFKRKSKRARPEDVKVVINQVWRTSLGPKKDYIFYERKVIIPDLAGNEDTNTELVGRYNMPKFRNVYNNQTGDFESVSHAGFELKYDIPYSPDEMRKIFTEQEVEVGDDKQSKVITVPPENIDSTNTVFTLVVNDRRYGGFVADDFIERPYDELVQLAQHGQIINPVSKSFNPQQIRSRGDTVEQQERRQKQLEEEEEIELQNAYTRVHELEQQREKEIESEERKQEEEAKKRQEAVDQQSQKRVVRAEATARFDKEGEGEEGEANTTTASNSPEVERIKEEVIFHLGRPEDQNINEDEEIAKQFKAQEESTKRPRKQKNQ